MSDAEKTALLAPFASWSDELKAQTEEFGYAYSQSQAAIAERNAAQAEREKYAPVFNAVPGGSAEAKLVIIEKEKKDAEDAKPKKSGSSDEKK